ncbi:MAG TPA: hypothetical protein EYG54_06810 [Myxococcales bacterium]|nr:hypothetical protein [Myxococcales bacterium]
MFEGLQRAFQPIVRSFSFRLRDAVIAQCAFCARADKFSRGADSFGRLVLDFRGETGVMDNDEYGGRLPTWFHRCNWAGGALACLGIGIYPGLAWEASIPALVWAVVWLVLGAGAARNAWRGINSIHVPARFRRRPNGKE